MGGTASSFGLNFALLAAVVCLRSAAMPATELWRSNLLSSDVSTPYRASTAILDAADNLFVGGARLTPADTVGKTPFVVKFGKTGLKLWEYTPSATQTNRFSVEGLATDGLGGVFAALGNAEGGVQLLRLGEDGSPIELDYASDYWLRIGEPLTAVNIAADGNGGFYLTGLRRLAEEFPLALSRYSANGNLAWRTNLFPSFLNNYGMGHITVVHSNGVFVCGIVRSNFFSRVVRLNGGGVVCWTSDSLNQGVWSRIEILNDETVCVSGERSYALWSGQGDRLAYHQTVGFCGVGRTMPDARSFLMADRDTGVLPRVGADGSIQRVALCPVNSFYAFNLAETINLTSNLWLVAMLCPDTPLPSSPSYLNLFLMDARGSFKWRQRLPGYEYTPSLSGNHWLFRASDGTVRLVVNLKNGASSYTGVSAASFSVLDSTFGPALISTAPTVTNGGPGGVTLQVQAAGSGTLRYQWRHRDFPIPFATNASLTTTQYTSGLFAVEVSDDDGEITSPASLVRAGPVRLSQTKPEWLNWMADYGVQVRLETSTNLIDWATDPVIYSPMLDLPTSILPTASPAPTARFFRTRELPP